MGHRRRGERARPRLAHDVRVLERELEASEGGGRLPDGVQPRPPAASARRAPPDERPRAVPRPARLEGAAFGAEGDGGLGGAHPRQHRDDPDDRVQLRRPGRGRRRSEEADRRPRCRTPEGREADSGIDLPTAVPPGHAGPRPHHPHQRRGTDQQFPPLAGGVQRALLHAGLLARLRSRAPVRGRSETSRSGPGVSARSPRTTRTSSARRLDPTPAAAASDRERGGPYLWPS